MKGPFKPDTFKFKGAPPDGLWVSSNIKPGQLFEVIQTFTDADGTLHNVSERWQLITAMFDKFSDTITLCVRSDAGEEWSIPFIWKPHAHSHIVENLEKYLQQVPS